MDEQEYIEDLKQACMEAEELFSLDELEAYAAKVNQ
jgi:hypothetical protein